MSVENKIPEEGGENELIDDLLERGRVPNNKEEFEKLRIESPLKCLNYFFGTELRKKIPIDKAKKKIEILMDHSIKITDQNDSGLGTGGIIDYVIPNKPNV